ncbi:enoyl-CoA hydratase/isomerase family protein [Pseudomonas citronellolis]|uniref:enoyl-CoA hydratase/isomerase family protein n=1 Tax=Pseudomonas citronellolis TaxID=53408 RepID=UPI0021C0B355|nr:enoyl-CoA hydratase/isomerase family protein [Pseudomonas citronellolis]UXJ50166.1 enoyl-CoA hydratase/isomerase family protein [Pseudomonas citronellolis]
MSHFKTYANRFANIELIQRDGILQMSLHTEGGSLQWGALDGSIHTQLGNCFREIAGDTDIRVLIITGKGNAFCDGMNLQEIPQEPMAQGWHRLLREGKELLMNLLDIEVPVIGAINGPAYIHAEIPVLSDIVLASENAELADLAHFIHGVVPGDGVQVVWPMLLGPNRGRHFLLTGQRLSAAEAHALGVVAEVLPQDQLLTRAWELAQTIARQPAVTTRYTRVAFTQPIKRRLLDELGYGLALEGLATIAMTH